MNVTPAGGGDDEETAREWRIKIVLLAAALILVGGYAAALNDIGRLFSSLLAAPAGSAIMIGAGAAPLGAVVLATILLLRSRLNQTSQARPAGATDALGGLANRKGFLETLARLCQAHSRAGRQFAVHIIDIDRFRAVNQAGGEAEGDAFLRSLAERLLLLVPEPDCLARLGDDEFAVVQPDAGSARQAEDYARLLQNNLKEVCAQVARHVRPGASIGVAVFPDHGSEPAGLLRSAWLALDCAKRAGGDCFRVYTRDTQMAVEDRLQIEKAIGNALHEGWFELHYQPLYDLSTRRLTGFEALVRMQHPERGELLPDAFLPAAEESGLIQPLGDWVVGEALSAAADWPSHLTLAVNVSAAQFRQGDAAGAILDSLLAAEISPARLRIEIPECVLLDTSDAVHEQLRRLNSSGVIIVLDDFGLATSSLQMLARSPCYAVKLDRSFVRRVGQAPEIEDFLRRLIGTAKSFGLAIMAEGVERAEQAQFLLSHDCRHVQGYLFGRPVPMRDVGAIIAKDMRKMTAARGFVDARASGGAKRAV